MRVAGLQSLSQLFLPHPDLLRMHSRTPHLSRLSRCGPSFYSHRLYPELNSFASAWIALVCIVGVARTWTGYLLNTGILPVLLIIACPVCCPSCIFAIELWVDSLPSQVIFVVKLCLEPHGCTPPRSMSRKYVERISFVQFRARFCCWVREGARLANPFNAHEPSPNLPGRRRYQSQSSCKANRSTVSVCILTTCLQLSLTAHRA